MWLYNQLKTGKYKHGGYSTSQIFANIYFNEVDQYIKHKLRIKYVYRYMDGAVILIKTRREAKDALEKI